MIYLTPLDIAKFWIYVEIDESTPLMRTSKKWLGRCWKWKGHHFQSGYGHYSFHQKAYRSHRVSFFICNGEIPEGMIVCHKCDNPGCVNPQHLFLGTPKDNTHDMMKKGRLVRTREKHKDSTSKYAGISFRKEKKSKKWRARIMRNYQTVWKGEFDSEEDAHKSRIQALKDLLNS